MDLKNYPDVEILNKIFYITGLGFILLQKSIDSFEKAKTFLEDTESGWYQTICEMQNVVRTFYDNTFAYIEILKKKNELKKNPLKNKFFDYSFINDSTIKNGLEFITKEFSSFLILLSKFFVFFISYSKIIIYICIK